MRKNERFYDFLTRQSPQIKLRTILSNTNALNIETSDGFK